MSAALEPGVELTTLPNGLRVITHQMPHLQSATLGVWVASGSRHESKALHGISHLLEHMAFKSTMSRTTRQMAEEIEAVGGEINASTGAETTAYYARVLAPDTGLALELLADMLLNPRFDPEELARETGVIVQEIAGARDQPDDIVFEQAEDAAFAKQALGRPILGTKQSVTRITPDDLREHVRRNYSAARMVISAAGAVTHDAIVRHAKTLFGGSFEGESQSSEPAKFVGGVRLADKAFEQHHVLLAFEGPSYLDPQFYDAQVLTGILGGGTSSRLFQKVREEHGLCYGIDAFGWSYADSGVVGVHAATSSSQVRELMTMVAGEIRDLADKGPNAAELQRTKAQIRAGILMSLESSAARAEQMARHVLVHGAPVGSSDLIGRIDKVSADDIRGLARKVFGAKSFVWSEVGPGAKGKYASDTIALLG
jgi:predicted Zn-dependent peptidase